MAEYTKLEYIESTGIQYIDTGFKPNSNTRVIMDFEPMPSSEKSGHYAFFGARTPNGKRFAAIKASAQDWNLYWQFGETVHENIWYLADIGEYAVRRTVDANGATATATIDGVTKISPQQSFQSDYSLYLLASNESGTVKYLGFNRLYSCKIYDNGTLVRDYVPCKTASGEIGLLDTVEGKFYGNAGTGVFVAGPEIPEEVALDPTSMLMGWLAGDVIVSARGKKA